MAKHFVILALAILSSLTCASYAGWKVIKINGVTAEQVDTLEAADVDVWAATEDGVILQLSPQELPLLSSFANYTILEDDLQSAIDLEMRRLEESAVMSKAQPVDQLAWFTQYKRYEEIKQYFETLERQSNQLVRLVKSVGSTAERRDIFAVHFNANDSKKTSNKPKIWVQCLIHAREWISGPVCQYIAHSLVQGQKSGDRQVLSLLARAEIVMVPVVNPDGYIHSWTGNRLWRKNRNGHGIDLNRNFPEQWSSTGRHGPAHELYGGKAAGSEPETQAVMNYYQFISSKGPVIGALDFHSFGQMVLRPLGYTKQPAKHDEFLRFASNRVVQAMKLVGGRIYFPQRSSELYLNSGTAIDWFHARGTRYSLAIELPPGTASSNVMQGFMLPPTEILPVCKDSWAGFLSFSDFVLGNPLP